MHGSIYGSIIVMGAVDWFRSRPPQGEVEIGYEVLDEPPQPAKEEHRIARSQAPVAPTEPKLKVEPKMQELHDENGEAAGVQKAQPVNSSLGATSDGDSYSTPYYKIKPKYPKAALISGMEGWILLLIDITETGEVENVRVLDGENRNMFAAEARRAVEKWRYRPPLGADGQPVRKDGHQVRVDFKLSDN